MSVLVTALWIEQEKELDAVIAVSGSGPAYFFMLIETMTNAGVKLGIPHKIAKQLATHDCARSHKNGHQQRRGCSRTETTCDFPGPNHTYRR